MPNCYFCGSELIWNADHDLEDCGFDTNGIMSELSCPRCKATAVFMLEMNKDLN